MKQQKTAGKRRIVTRAGVALMLAVMIFLPVTGTAYAASTPPTTPAAPAASDFECIEYVVARHDGSINTGGIFRGETVTLTVTIYDKRIQNAVVTPIAAINTASFSLGNASYIELPGQVQADANGCMYQVRFHDAVYTGVGNSFNFAISYQGAAVEVIEHNITLNQAVPAVDPPKTETPVKHTTFIMKDSKYGEGGPVYAGQPFDLSATVLATSGDSAIENVTITFLPPEKLTFADGSSVFYVGTMQPNASAAAHTRLLPGADIAEGSYTITVDASGVNAKTGDAVSAKMTISVPVLQPERFEIFKTQLPTDMRMNSNDGGGYGSVTVVNQGKGVISNVSIEITGDGLTAEEGRQYVGNVNTGEQKATDFNLHASEMGAIKAMVIVSYENTRGEQKRLEQAFDVNVTEEPAEAPDMGMIEADANQDAEGSGMNKWLLIGIGVAAVIVVIVIVTVARKKRIAAKEAALNDMSSADDEE